MTDDRPDAIPPRLAERIVRFAAGRDGWAELMTGDLREEFAAISSLRGSRAARTWYYRESARVLAVVLGRSGRRAARAFFSLFRPEGDHPIRTLLQEARLALRSLFRQPLITGIVLLTLALGLGANAATFGMIDSLLLRPFSFPNVDRLVMLSENSAADPYPQESVAPGNFLDFERQATTLDGLAAFRWWDVNLAGTSQPERVEGFSVTGNFFSVLGITPALGRLLGAQDMAFGRHRQVVLADGLWRRHFGADAAIVGRPISLDGVPYTIVGVAPPGFDFPKGAELWVAYGMDAEESANRTRTYATVIGRLRPEATFEQAEAEFAMIYARIKAEHAEATRGRRLVVRTFTEGMVDVGTEEILLLWQAAAALVLLIGCTNIANLLLARGAARQRELAVRLAIGAGRWRLMRQLLVESLVLSLMAVPLALAVAAAAIHLCKVSMPGEIVRFVPGWTAMGVNAKLILFTAAGAVLSAAAFGLLPALQASRPAVTSALRDGGRSVTGIAARSRLRRGLVVAEIALALPLLIASGLSAIGAQRFATGPQGYDPDGLFRVRTILSDVSYPDDASRRVFVERLLDAARLRAGVEMAGTSSSLPSSGSNQQRALTVDGRPPDPDNPLTINYRAVSPGYLPVLRVPILQGRGLTDADRADTEPVAIISLSAAERYWPGQSGLGRRIRLGAPDRPWTTIVGVSGDTIDDWFDRRRAPTVYVPVAQAPNASIGLVLRTSGDPASLADAARAIVAAVDPTQPVFQEMTMREALRIRTIGLRFLGTLMAVFGGLALVLAAVGIYSVMAFYVAQRRHEMSIRMALGATAGDVVRFTIGHGARMAGLGIVIGLLIGVALARVLEGVLFGIVALEPWLVVTIAMTLAAVAFVASLIPARYAARTDPIHALRE